MKQKIRIGIIFGGRSAEHEVSIQSAKNVFDALDKIKYEPVLIGISKKGEWMQLPSKQFLQIASHSYQALPEKIHNDVTLNESEGSLEILRYPQNDKKLDVIFPVLHGPYGEDGSIQGLLKTVNIPFVGAGVLGSALGMDKDVMKRLLREAGLPVVKFIVLKKTSSGGVILANEVRPESSEKRFWIHKGLSTSWGRSQDDGSNGIVEELGLPLFVKPANLGSSIGVTKVTDERGFQEAIDEAFRYDCKLLIEKGIDARELECSVLGNEEKIASVPGEVLPTHEFYDYEAKYLDKDGAKLAIPAKLTKKQTKQVQMLAVKACHVLCGDGMARVDFFLERKTNKLYINEINTIPGFTAISMYPKLWEASSISYPELLDRLIQLALDRHKKEQQLQTSR